MSSNFHGWRRKVGWLTWGVAIFCFVASTYWTGRNPQSLKARVRIDPDAFAAIDDSRLEPPLRDFIKLLDSPIKIIGQPKADFAELFALSLSVKNLGSIDAYEFVTPSTRAQQQQLSRDCGQVVCSPTMIVNVDSKSNVIRSVEIRAWCF